MNIKKIKLRKANKSDCDLIFKYINTPNIRNNSYNQNEIDYSEHKEWFIKKIKSNNFLMLIAEDEKKTFLGQLKFEKENNNIVVGVFTNPELHNKGIGSKILKLGSDLAINYFNVDKISAYIKLNNKISIKAFRKAGYSHFNNIEINSIPSVEMHYFKK